MKKFFLVSALAFFASSTAFADVIDRINRCEDRNGANGCVYDILRELANGSQSDPGQIITYCRCVDPGYNYLMNLIVYTENIRTGEVESRTLQSFTNNDSACYRTLETHPRCNLN